MRIACSKSMTKGNVLIFKQIFSTTCNSVVKEFVWTLIWRICIWMLELKGLTGWLNNLGRVV